jgi:hypothetical protein
VQVKKENVTFACENPSGTSDLVSLKTSTVPIAVYDNFIFQECVAQCATFYWKKVGTSNCVCMKAAEKQDQTTTSLADVSIKSFQPTCLGGDADYGFYQVAPQSSASGAMGRNLLQQQDSDSNSTNNSESDELSSSEEADLSELNNTLQADALSEETDGFQWRGVNNSNSSSFGSNGSTLLIVPLESEFNTTEQESQEALETANLNIVNLIATQSQEGSSEEDMSWIESSSEESRPPKLCFNVPLAPKNRTEVVCSSKASTPPALPRAWLLMNNLNPDTPAACATWKPAVGSKSIGCVNLNV